MNHLLDVTVGILLELNALQVLIQASAEEAAMRLR
jgi:hypothetical protein